MLFDEDELDSRELEASILQMVARDEVEESLRLQLSEMEMLQSMFSNPGEFCVDNHAVLADINEYLDGHSETLPSRLDFTVNLLDSKGKVEMCVNLAHDYPSSEPDIYVRSDQFSRDQQHLLNQELAQFVSSLDRGEICICSAVSWLQEHMDPFLQNSREVQPAPIKSKVGVEQEEDLVFARHWIYSHHIYSKIKRREILDLAHEYHITGFCLPGKPGIICVEGSSLSCEEWWLRIKSMNWKRIICKKVETEKTKSKLEFSTLRKFSTFEEISFERGKNNSRDYHMDMGEFCRYLHEHQCEDIFKEYFGFSGRTSTSQQPP